MDQAPLFLCPANYLDYLIISIITDATDMKQKTVTNHQAIEQKAINKAIR
ncbi:MAG: hypothetical protein ACK456_13960 [Pseudanabaenaceae cyanobacterium]